MTKDYLGLSFAGIICIFGMFGIIPLACAEDTGELTLDLIQDATVMKTAQEFQLMHIKVVKLTDETEVVFFEFDIIEQEDINISVPAGTYKLYIRLQGHRTIWELDNESRGYEVLAGSTTVVPLWENTLLKDVFADAPWRTETDNIPILVMVKDAAGIAGDYDLGNVEIYLDEDCDKDNNEADDILLETVTKWYGVTVSGSFYNLYYPGDWYGITYLDPSEHDLSGEACFHVVIREIGGGLDPDSDTHSHFNVNIASDTLPALTNWHAGDTHYHSSYTDNLVEFGFPVEATVEAGKVIGLDWNAITDHSFDIRDSKTIDPNHKFNALKSDVISYNTGSYRLILGEEVSCYGHKNPPNPLVPRGVIHFLIFGMENFNNVGGTGLDFIPGGHDEQPEGGLTWNLEDVIYAVNSQGGVSYAAHPEGHRGASADALDRVPWITEDYDLVGYNGLQVWNMIDNDHERDLGLEQWKRLLLNDRKDIFIAGGSDAHGDFSHATTVIGPMDNAFGKVRTYIYCEEFTKEGILNALKNGQSIMTDGPLVIFNITNERSETAIIGHEITGYNLILNIQWESTSEFGNISHIYIHRGIINETEVEISEYGLTPDNFSGAGVYSDLAGKIPLMKNGYIRINATSDKGYSVYTNPIWINSPASIISNVSVTGITANSTTITWDTNGPSDSLVKYSTESGNYTLLKYNHNNVTSHTINLTGLIPNTTYYFVVNSTDTSCNSNESNEYSLRTIAIPDTTPPVVINTSPENLAINVKIETNITATFNEPMNSSTLNNNTVKVYSLDRIMGETFEDTNGSWNSSNFQAFRHAEQLAVWQTPIDDIHRTIGAGNLTYSTQPLLRDYQFYSNEGIEVEDSGNYSVIGWLGEEHVVVDNLTSKWIISKLVFEQNSSDTKTLHIGETWDLGDGYSLKLHEIDGYDDEAWIALEDSSGEIDNKVCDNQSAYIISVDLGAADKTPIFVTYLNKVNYTNIELKYTWLVSQDTITIQNGQSFGDFTTKTFYDKIILDNDEAVILSEGDTILLFDDYKFEVKDTSTVRYRLVHQAEPPLEGDISYNSSGNTVTFDPVSNLYENTDYFPLITTGAKDLAGNGLTEDCTWTFRTIDETPPIITDMDTVVTSTTATITWNTTGDSSNSTVRYNESGNLTILEVINTEYVELHNILLGFLKQNTTYYYYTVSTDQAGNTNESSIHTFTTLTVPVVTIHSPPSITNDSTPLLNATFDQIVTSAWYVLDGAAGTGWHNTDHLITTLSELSDGPHRVVVDAIDYKGDHMGNIGTAIQNFLIDTTLPTTIITEPKEEAYVNRTIDIIGTANDTNFRNYTVEWKNTSVDWTEIQNSPVFVSDGTLVTWDTTTMEDGNYLIRLTARDDASNSNMALVNVTIDNTPPIATAYVVYEKGTAANNDSIITLNVSASDNPDGSGVKYVTANVSAINSSDLITLTRQGSYWTGGVVVFATDGNHSVNITVMDNTSNVNYIKINVTMDNTPPAVSNVTAQPDIINISGYTNITAVVRGADVYNVSVRITYPNGTHSTIYMNNSSHVYYRNFSNTANPGRYNVTIIANDTTGNVNDTQNTSFIVAHIYTNTTIITNAGNSTFINASGANVTLELFTNGSVKGSINITRSIVNITNEFEVPGPGIYIRINASTNFSNDTYSNLSWALIKVNYADEDVSNNNLVDSSLRLYWYNESSGNWIKLETNSPTWVYGSGVDTANNYVWANVSQFSDYAVGGELEKEDNNDDNGVSGGGSSSGGGGSSGEDFYNIVLSETDRQSVFKNTSVSFIFDLEDNIVRHINFTALKSAGTIAAKVEMLNNTSTLVSTPPTHEAYKNLNIWVGNAGWATKRNIADATVVFTVDKSWITKNNIDESSIALYRYSDDNWSKLVTRKIAEDANSLQFEAETPGFSPFAVTGKELEGEPGGEAIIAEPAVTVEKTPVPTPTEKKGIPGFSIFAGLSVLLIAVQLLHKNK
jgi:S-layer protein (TIGR01567 family)